MSTPKPPPASGARGPFLSWRICQRSRGVDGLEGAQGSHGCASRRGQSRLWRARPSSKQEVLSSLGWERRFGRGVGFPRMCFPAGAVPPLAGPPLFQTGSIIVLGMGETVWKGRRVPTDVLSGGGSPASGGPAPLPNRKYYCPWDGRDSLEEGPACRRQAEPPLIK